MIYVTKVNISVHIILCSHISEEEQGKKAELLSSSTWSVSPKPHPLNKALFHFFLFSVKIFNQLIKDRKTILSSTPTMSTVTK